MPNYLFENPDNPGETKEVLQKMKDPHVFVVDGVKWRRVFLIPQAAFDAKLDPFSEKDFLNKTSKKKGTIGDLMDYSAEASEKRSQIAGKDKLKEKYFEKWSKTRRNRKHPEQHKQETLEKLKGNKHFEVEL